MKNLSNLSFCIRENTVSLKGEAPNGRTLFFYWTFDEFREFASTFNGSFVDIGHQLLVQGDTCLFYDIAPQTKVCGEVTVKFIQVHIPMFIRRILVRYMNRVLASREGVQNPEWVEVNLSSERVQRWDRLYGVGKGRSRVVLRSPETRKFVKECLRQDLAPENQDSLRKRLQTLRQIAQNSTSSFWETREVHISKDWDGFFFVVPGMHGGVINHGTPEEPRWSIHT